MYNALVLVTIYDYISDCLQLAIMFINTISKQINIRTINQLLWQRVPYLYSIGEEGIAVAI